MCTGLEIAAIASVAVSAASAASSSSAAGAAASGNQRTVDQQAGVNAGMFDARDATVRVGDAATMGLEKGHFNDTQALAQYSNDRHLEHTSDSFNRLRGVEDRAFGEITGKQSDRAATQQTLIGDRRVGWDRATTDRAAGHDTMTDALSEYGLAHDKLAGFDNARTTAWGDEDKARTAYDNFASEENERQRGFRGEASKDLYGTIAKVANDGSDRAAATGSRVALMDAAGPTRASSTPSYYSGVLSNPAVAAELAKQLDIGMGKGGAIAKAQAGLESYGDVNQKRGIESTRLGQALAQLGADSSLSRSAADTELGSATAGYSEAKARAADQDTNTGILNQSLAGDQARYKSEAGARYSLADMVDQATGKQFDRGVQSADQTLAGQTRLTTDDATKRTGIITDAEKNWGTAYDKWAADSAKNYDDYYGRSTNSWNNAVSGVVGANQAYTSASATAAQNTIAGTRVLPTVGGSIANAFSGATSGLAGRAIGDRLGNLSWSDITSGVGNMFNGGSGGVATDIPATANVA